MPQARMPPIPPWRAAKVTLILAPASTASATIAPAEARSGPVAAEQLDRHAGAWTESCSVGETLMPEVISVTPDNIDAVLAGLPRLARLALGFGSRLRRGTLDVTLPDGRVIRLGGLEPGPAAAMRLHNYGFASRLLNGGDIGIAEAYLSG